MGPSNTDRQNTSSSSVTTPWPQMGVLADSATTGFTPQSTIGNLSEDALPQRYTSPTIPGTEIVPGDFPADSSPIGLANPAPNAPSTSRPPLPPSDSPYITAHAGLPQQKNPATPHPQTALQTKKRRGLGLIIFGLLASFVLAPISMMLYVFIGADLLSLSSQMKPVAVKEEVTVDTSGGYFLLAMGPGTADGCELVATSGDRHRLESIPGAQPAWWANNLPSGTYTLSCDVTGTPNLLGTTNVDPQHISTQANYSALVATAVGITGLVLVVIGARQRAKR